MSQHFKGPEADANDLTGIRMRWWSVYSFSIGDNSTTVVEVPAVKKNTWITVNTSLCCTPKSVGGHFVVVLVWETTETCP